MVSEKRKTYSAPIYWLTIPALGIFYCSLNIAPFRLFSVCAVFIASLAAVFLSAADQAERVTGKEAACCRMSFLFLCSSLGILAGVLSAASMHGQLSSLKSLADRNQVSAVSVSFLSDPVPWGPTNCQVPCSVNLLSCRDGSSFSAQGNSMIVIPSTLERSSLPGGIARNDDPSVLFASGLSATFSGSFVPYKQNASECFYATSLVHDSSYWGNTCDLFRAKLRLSLMRILYDWKEAGGFLLALFSANRDYLDPGLAAEFKQTGLSHILALSGMHLSLLALVAIRVGKKIGGKRVSIRLSIFAIVFFVWFAGVSPSLDRALLMALFLISFRRLGINAPVLPVLALTAFIQMLFSPSDASSLAFMLSYGALWGIVTFGEYALDLIPARIKVYPVGELAASIGATLMTAPIISLSIGVIAPIGIISSCFVGPLSSLFLVTGMILTGISALIPPVSFLCGIIVNFLYRLTVFPVHFFARIPPLSIHGLPATIFACVLPLLAGFLLFFVSVQCRKRRSVDDCFARL